MTTTTVREGALEILEGVREITHKEMIAHGYYFQNAEDLTLTDAICRGHKACLMGSLWLGARVEPVENVEEAYQPELGSTRGDIVEVKVLDLPGLTDGDDVYELYRQRPDLELAVEAVDLAAVMIALERHDLVPRGDHIERMGEALFEAFDHKWQLASSGRPTWTGYSEMPVLDRNGVLELVDLAELIVNGEV